jgi:hypothetical protein
MSVDSISNRTGRPLPVIQPTLVIIAAEPLGAATNIGPVVPVLELALVRDDSDEIVGVHVLCERW